MNTEWTIYIYPWYPNRKKKHYCYASTALHLAKTLVYLSSETCSAYACDAIKS